MSFSVSDFVCCRQVALLSYAELSEVALLGFPALGPAQMALRSPCAAAAGRDLPA